MCLNICPLKATCMNYVVSVVITELSGADVQQLRQGKGPGNNTEASHYFHPRPLLGQL